MDSQDLRNLHEAYSNVYEATGRDEMIAANRARARAQKPTTGGTVRTPGGPVSTPGGPVKTPTTGPVAQAPKPSGLLGSLDKMARDTAGEIGSRIGEREGRNRTGNIPVISDIGGAIGRNKGRQQGQQMYDKAKETVGGLLKQDYEYDAFDIILEYLVAEGYADTNENALVIMANMSEEWKDIILEKEDSEYEKASDAALDARYGYGRAQGDKRSFGRAANRASAAAMLRRLRKDRDEGRETSRESGADSVHQGWAHTARTSEDQTPEKKERRAKLADTPYSQLPDDEKEKDRVSADAVRALYNKNKKR